MQRPGRWRLRIGASIAIAGLAPWGCGPSNAPMSPEASEISKLNEVGELYRVHQVIQGKPPKAPRDLLAVANGSPSGYEVINSGEVVVQWGVTLPDTAEAPGSGSSGEVLAYLKRVPERGGPVLLLDRAVRSMTAEEFKAAPKASPR